MRTIALATRNADKVREIRKILPGFVFIPMDEFPDAGDIEETGATLEENAVIKAKAAAGHTGLLSLADDSGLEVEALGGLPGVRSARFAGENASYNDNNEKLLRMLDGEKNRRARFRCVIAICSPSGAAVTAEGICAGRITEAPRGGAGFGYDPVFLVEGLGKTFAELSSAEKNTLSHRAAALKAAARYLKDLNCKNKAADGKINL